MTTCQISQYFVSESTPSTELGMLLGIMVHQAQKKPFLPFIQRINMNQPKWIMVTIAEDWVVWATPIGTQNLHLALCSGIISYGAWGTIQGTGDHGLTTCKANMTHMC